VPVNLGELLVDLVAEPLDLLVQRAEPFGDRPDRRPQAFGDHVHMAASLRGAGLDLLAEIGGAGPDVLAEVLAKPIEPGVERVPGHG
jgi:hypothetical protein